tara:strand:- start:366 stop:827 length:462 start_codon:yes stop_codon:yes gene_type:complete
MIITCEKCLKSFNIQDSLIPNEGRELQCGSCSYKWFFKKSENTITFKNQISETMPKDDELDNYNANIDLPNKEDENENKYKEPKKKSEIIENKQKPKIIKNSLVLIISVIAFIILLDTFKYQLNNYIPGLDSILNNLYESLKDLSLFFKDLLN